MKMRIKKIEDKLNMTVDDDTCRFHVFQNSAPECTCDNCGRTHESIGEKEMCISIIMKNEIVKTEHGNAFEVAEVENKSDWR